MKNVKKRLVFMTVAVIFLFSMAACGKESGSQDSGKETVEVKDSLEILTKVWEGYSEENKFTITGGDYNNMTDNAPGKFDVTDKESLRSLLVVPEDGAELIDDGASMIHMMNANTFTGAAFHVKDAADVKTFEDSLKEAVLNNQWMCGFPEKLVLCQLGEQYVVSAFGNGEMIEYFKTQLQEQYPGVTVVAEESLV